MDAEETHALGYERVDEDPNVSVLLGTLAPGDRGRFVSTSHAAAREGRFSMALTMHGVVAR